MRIPALLLAVGLLLSSSLTHARSVSLLSYQELLQRADVVVIVRPKTTRDAESNDPIAPMPRDHANRYLTPVVTSFTVLATVMGEFKPKELLLPHYRMDWEKAEKNGIQGIGNGPNLATFIDSEINEDEFDDVPGSRDYLLFLKRAADSSHDFVTGQFDPAFSVFRIGHDR